jgi:hypothetical protein
MIRTPIVIAGALTFAAMLPTTPALAQRDRVFVASYGSDSNPCTFGSPCKTFQQAVNVVALGGEVTAIDSAGFGPVTISHAVTITSPAGVEAGIAAAPSGTAITINAGNNDLVSLRGLTLNGSGTANTGIVYDNANRVEVIDCAISNFTNAGINIGPINHADIAVSNTTISNMTVSNSASGITAAAISDVIITLDIDRVAFNYDNLGINVTDGGGVVYLFVSNSHFSSSPILVTGSSNQSQNLAYLQNVTFDYGQITFNGYTTAYLSHVTGAYITMLGAETAAYGDGTSHFFEINGSAIGPWPGN